MNEIEKARILNGKDRERTIERIELLEEINAEKDKEIKRLNNIIEVYKNANEYHQNIIHELETMKQPNQLHSENVKLRAENNRLNNIINELEKWSEDYIFANIFKDKLQELKGSE